MDQAMRSFFAPALWLIGLAASAQVWCPPGATWHFSFGGGTSTTNGYERFTYSGDTLFDGENAQKILHEWDLYSWSGPTPQYIYYSALEFTHVENNVLYIRHNEGGWFGGYWDTLIWYGATPGDHWEILQAEDAPCPCDYVVVDTGHTVMGGLSLRFVQTEVDCPGMMDPDSICFIERVGSFRGTFLDECGIGSADTTLRCYEDVDMTLTTGIADSCDFINGIPSARSTLDIHLWPNPGSDQVLISWDPMSQVERVTVRDALGRLVRDLVPTTASLSIPTHAWAAGVYSIHFALPGSASTVVKWIKE